MSVRLGGAEHSGTSDRSCVHGTTHYHAGFSRNVCCLDDSQLEESAETPLNNTFCFTPCFIAGYRKLRNCGASWIKRDESETRF